MKKEDNRHFDAFISYRHTPLDMFVAKTLQKKLEEFKLPKNIERKQAEWEKKKIERVFRDQDELPLTSDLSDQIYQALTMSDYLIVICSPRIVESLWCQQEIQTFIEMKGFDHVLAVLIEGEPEESFPPEMVFRQEYRTDEYGNEVLCTVPIEPLAADVRGKSKKEIKKKIDEAVVRIAAAIFDVNYDDLKRRHRERMIKKGVHLATLGAAFFAAFGLYAGFQAIRFAKQNERIAAQAAELKAKNEAITSQSQIVSEQGDELKEQYQNILRREAQDYGIISCNYLEKGQRDDALSYAYMSVTQDEDGNELPVTYEGIKALFQSTYAYEFSRNITPCVSYDFDKEIVAGTVSPGYGYIILIEENGVATIYSLNSLEEVRKIEFLRNDSSDKDERILRSMGFLDEETIIYMNSDWGFTVYNFIEDREVFTYDTMGTSAEMYEHFIPLYGKHQAIIQCTYSFYLLDCETYEMELIYTSNPYDNALDAILSSIDSFMTNAILSVDGNGVTIDVITNDDAIDWMDDRFIYIDLEEKDIKYQVDIHSYYTGTDSGRPAYFFDGDKFFIYGEFDSSLENNENGKPHCIRCYDANSNELLWEQPVYNTMSGGKIMLDGKSVDEFNELILSIDNSVHILDKRTGEILFSETFPGDVVNWMVHDGSNVVRVCTDDGCLYSIVVEMDQYSNFGKNLGEKFLFVYELNDHIFAVPKDSKSFKIWGKHIGTRIEERRYDLNSSEDIYAVFPDMENICVNENGKLIKYNMNNRVPAWELDIDATMISIYQNGKIFVKDSKSFYYINPDSGEILFSKDLSDSNINLISHEPMCNSLFYTKDNGKTVYKMDANTFEEEAWADLSFIDEEMSFGGLIVDGRYLIVIDDENDLYRVASKEGEYQDYTIREDKQETIFYDEQNAYLLVQFKSGFFEIYDLEKQEIIYESDRKLNQITGFSYGNEDLSYIITTRGQLSYFYDKDFNFIGRADISLNVVTDVSQAYFVSDKRIYTVPIYTVDQFIEDALGIMNGKISNGCEK